MNNKNTQTIADTNGFQLILISDGRPRRVVGNGDGAWPTICSWCPTFYFWSFHVKSCGQTR